MSGKSNKTKVVTFRLPNDVHAKIVRALKTPTNGNSSVSDYCKSVVTRYAFRHDRYQFRNRKEESQRPRLL